jgi:hypothetical protein
MGVNVVWSRRSLYLIQLPVVVICLFLFAVVFVRNSYAQALSNLNIDPSQTIAGLSASGTVELSAPAPAGGLEIHLFATSPLASVPSSVIVPEGQNFVTFSISTDSNSPATSVNIWAWQDNPNITKIRPLFITPVWSDSLLMSVVVEPSQVDSGVNARGTIYLNKPSPTGGITFNLSSGDTKHVKVPKTLKIGAGLLQRDFVIRVLGTPVDLSVGISSNSTSPLLSSYDFIYVKTSILDVTPTLSVNEQNGTVKLTWNHIPEIGKYSITYSSDGVNFTEIHNLSIDNPSATVLSYEDSGFMKGSPISYSLKAENQNGQAPENSPTEITVLPGMPQKVTNLKSIPGDQSSVLFWDSVEEASEYYVYRRAGGTGSFVYVTTVSEPKYRDSGLQNSVVYEYVVRAVNTAGYGIPSDWIACTPLSAVSSLTSVVNKAKSFSLFVGVPLSGTPSVVFPEILPSVGSGLLYHGRVWSIRFEKKQRLVFLTKQI